MPILFFPLPKIVEQFLFETNKIYVYPKVAPRENNLKIILLLSAE